MVTLTAVGAVPSCLTSSLQLSKHLKSVRRLGFSTKPHLLSLGNSFEHLPAVCAVLPGAVGFKFSDSFLRNPQETKDTKDIAVSSKQSEELSVTAATSDSNELTISVEVSGTQTRAIFDQVFDKMVAAAQPIPGFRRVKGGKTPNIPRDVLLEVLGPTKVYKEVIKKVINSTVAEYVEKESLKVSKDLRVVQSFEDLEASFEPGEEFSFDAVVHYLK